MREQWYRLTKMNLLMINPDIPETRRIKNNVAWETFGVSRVTTVYNEENVLQTAEEQQPELLMMSTGISGDGGLSLLPRLRRLLPEAGILLTGTPPDGAGIRSLLQAGVSDLLPEPVSEPVLCEALEAMILKKNEQHRAEEETRYGRYWRANRRQLQEMFWKRLCLNRIPGGPQEIESAAAEVEAELDKDKRYRLVLTTLRNEDEMQRKWGEEFCQNAVQNLMRSSLKKSGDQSKVLVIYTRVILILEPEEAQAAEECLKELAERCRKELSAELLFYFGEPVFCEEFAESYASLLSFSKDDVLQQSQMIHVREGMGGGKKEIMVPEQWSELLYAKEPGRLSAEVEHFLVPLARAGQLNEQNFRIFQQDMLQLFFTYMEKKEMRAHELYENEEIYRLYKIAILSIEGMCRWVSACTEYITGKNRPENEAHGMRMVRQVKEYVHANLRGEISLSQISGVTHLNPDYMTRIFKHQTGMTVHDYVIRKRMEHAKNLLQTSALSVSEIAMESGYDNFSYFIRVFKKHCGMTPKQYRREFALSHIAENSSKME